ncbi:hypothetical protein [Paenibacillus donghaensis]|uniref:hypothetical protein n=1 Tax=Paenibacillus donghaensis TaxID=414771 RepID=UPI0012FD89E5|nr:hypothetical protein [Paenibacillus donghaensis]
MMSDKKYNARTEEESEDLVTERDIDEDFGLFQEGSFPGALPDDDQIDAINHAVPEKKPD